MNGIFPKGVVNVIHGAGASVGNQLINHRRVEGISVTGSPATGKKAMEAASRQIRHTHLELGGKAPVIVFDDADLDVVVETIRGGSYFNAGQDCAQPCRIYADKSVSEKLTAEIALCRVRNQSRLPKRRRCGDGAADFRDTAGSGRRLYRPRT